MAYILKNYFVQLFATYNKLRKRSIYIFQFIMFNILGVSLIFTTQTADNRDYVDFI